MHEYDPTAEPAADMDIAEQPTATAAPIAAEATPGAPAAEPTPAAAPTPAPEPTPAAPHPNGGPAPGWDPAAFAAAQQQSAHPPQQPAAPHGPPPTWGQPGPNGYPQYHQPAVPGYGPPVYGPPPVPPQAPEPPSNGGRGQRGLIIALAGLIAALLLGAGVAVIMVVSGSDHPPRPGTTAAAAPRTVTTVIRETTVRAKPTSSRRTRSSRTRRSSRSTRSVSSTRRSTASTASASSPTVARAGIKSMLQRHFANIRDGNLSSAYADLGASLAQSQTSWISDIRDDGLYSFNLAVAPEITSPTTAIANIVSFHTEANASGCKNWSGSWNVAKSGGRWLITKSNLSQTVVSCGE
jgi:hypothetical protein